MTNILVVVALVAHISTSLSSAQTLVDVALNLGATTFVEYLNVTGLLPAFTDNGKFTLFVPTNAAFDALPADLKSQLTSEPDLLRKVLMFHGADGIKYSSQLTNDKSISSLVLNADIRINIYNTVVTASGSQVVRADINATNGVVHLLSRVMFPLPLLDAVQSLASNTDLGTLLYSVAMTPLRTALEEPGPFTIFAPNNAAFDNLQPGYWSNLLNQNYTAYIDMLKYHVVPGTFYSLGLSNGPMKTLSGQTLRIQRTNKGIMVNNATVITADQTMKNGVFHIIDAVLIPSHN